jgi:hypothetical protein
MTRAMAASASAVRASTAAQAWPALQAVQL